MPDSENSSGIKRDGSSSDEFASFVEDHYRGAYLFAMSLCGRHEEACDLTQQAFYIAQTKGGQVRDVSKRKQWLHTVLRREFLSTRRRAAAHPHEPVDSLPNDIPAISVDYVAAMDSKGILVVLEGLEEIFRTPLTLFYLQQFSYKEIAEVLETPVGTVMSRLFRGKALLREQLEISRRQEDGDIVKITSNGSEERAI